MKHITFDPNTHNQYDVGILIKEAAFNKEAIKQNYILPIGYQGLNAESIIAFSLDYTEHNKAPAKLIKTCLADVIKAAKHFNIKTLLVADTNYFKTLTKSSKAEPHHGYILPCKFDGGEGIDVILSVNYQALFYNPAVQDKLTMSINTLCNHHNGTHEELGKDVIHNGYYPYKLVDIEAWLEVLLEHPVLTCDIETFSLDFDKAGIGTIAFAWDMHNGVAFSVDRSDDPARANAIKTLLFTFFEKYQGKLMYHNGNFDIKVLIYELFMNDLLDIEGLIYGLDIMYQLIDDTKIITYLAVNSTAGNTLSLKANSFEFAGNYAQDDEDIKDITRIPIPDLLKYNLTDCLATWYVYEKNYPIMVQDNQLDIYNEIMLPSMKVITHMELIGMPMNEDEINIADKELTHIREEQIAILRKSKMIKNFEWILQTSAMRKANALLKKKVRPIEEFVTKYNPASHQQTQKLLYEEMGLPVIDLTKTKQPAVGAKTLQKLLNKLIHEHKITDEELNQ